MDTADISYRVADFLKKHAPFHTIDDADLLALTAGGRVRFYEPNEYILWQGEPHKAHVLVMQQGTVSLWDEAGSRAELRDVRGAGDMLGIERYNGARSALYSARSESDVVVYAFSTTDFEDCVLKYPHAAQYIAAESQATPDYQPAVGTRDPQSLFVYDVIGATPLLTCGPQDSIADAARRLAAGGAEAIAVVDEHHRAIGVITADSLLDWVAAGGGDAGQPIESLASHTPAVLRPDASLTDGMLAMGVADEGVVAITADGTREGSLQALVTPRDLAPLFGEHPATLLRAVRHAGTVQQLRALNQRARALTLEFLTGAASVEWLTRFTHLIDAAVLTRLIALTGSEHSARCWTFCGSSGREESLTALAPYLLVMIDKDEHQAPAYDAFIRVRDSLGECGYLPRPDLPRESAFYVASIDEWTTRYRNWVADPVRQQTYQVRNLFDVRVVHGDASLWTAVEAAVTESVDRDFVRILANDCLASLPPLTFFQDAVVDNLGEHSSTFLLEHSALRPLVDVGRVFGLAAKQALGRSTLGRFATARALLPEHEAIFREAADTLKIVLWQQGRIGISQGTSGSDLPPSLLSRHDRQVLKGGFRSILRLLEFTAAGDWLREL